ncbi:MAG: hypothetical protein JJT89_13540 [Nitriliruptoraceae bacterium]|nr:hypothetical protein [Nitriliruptoraceae bacterium]
MNDHALATVARHLEETSEALALAVTDADHFGAIANETETATRRGWAMAHQDLARNRWAKALGARAALEALYQELSGGVPSPSAAQDDAVLDAAGVSRNPIGIEGREVHRLDDHEFPGAGREVQAAG